MRLEILENYYKDIFGEELNIFFFEKESSNQKSHKIKKFQQYEPSSKNFLFC